jgi:hypothetical protein
MIIRFNKFFQKYDEPPPIPLTLGAKDYPLSDQNANILQKETMADSVITARDLQLALTNEWKYDPVTKATINPVYPENGETFWREFRDVQRACRKGVLPSDLFTMHEIWEGKTLQDVADAVNGGYPASIQQAFIETVYKNGEKLLDMGQPFRSNLDFIGKQVRMAAINNWSFEAVAAVNFMLK